MGFTMHGGEMLFFGRRKGNDRRSGKDRRGKAKPQHESETPEAVESRAGRDRRSKTERRSGTPRRKHQRFRLIDAVFVEVRNSTSKVGQVIDISKGGLSFRYIDIGDRPKESCKIDLVVKNNDNGFLVENLPFTTVADQDAPNKFVFSSVPMRRRSGRFGDLTEEQFSRLEKFIRKHSLGLG